MANEPTEFDVEKARREHTELLAKVERIRDGLTKDAIEYYRRAPTSEQDQKETQAGIRKYLVIALESIDAMLHNELPRGY